MWISSGSTSEESEIAKTSPAGRKDDVPESRIRVGKYRNEKACSGKVQRLLLLLLCLVFLLWPGGIRGINNRR